MGRRCLIPEHSLKWRSTRYRTIALIGCGTRFMHLGLGDKLHLQRGTSICSFESCCVRQITANRYRSCVLLSAPASWALPTLGFRRHLWSRYRFCFFHVYRGTANVCRTHISDRATAYVAVAYSREIYQQVHVRRCNSADFFAQTEHHGVWEGSAAEPQHRDSAIMTTH